MVELDARIKGYMMYQKRTIASAGRCCEYVTDSPKCVCLTILCVNVILALRLCVVANTILLGNVCDT